MKKTIFILAATLLVLGFFASQSSALASTSPPELVRAQPGHKVYKIISEKKFWVPSPQAFNRLKLKWSNVRQVAHKQLNQYPRLKLAKEAGTDKIWYLTEGGLRRHILTDEVFSSYGNRYEDVVELDPETLSAYPINNLIRLESGYKVYKIEGNKKRWIKAAQEFNRLGYKWGNIVPVNQTELDAYEEGEPIIEFKGERGYLSIKHPQDGEVFKPGEDVNVQIDVEKGLDLKEIFLGSSGIIKSDQQEPFEFSFTLPNDKIGPYKISALGFDYNDKSYYDVVTINVKTSETLNELFVSPQKLEFSNLDANYPKGIHVEGKFSDGVTREITENPDTTYYSHNTEVATVDQKGNVTCLGKGSATITVAYQDKQATVEVYSSVANHQPTAHISPEGPVTVSCTKTTRVQNGVSRPTCSETIQFNANDSTDPDEDNLEYIWEIVSGEGHATLSGQDTQQVVFSPDYERSYAIRLTIQDGYGGLDREVVEIFVE